MGRIATNRSSQQNPCLVHSMTRSRRDEMSFEARDRQVVALDVVGMVLFAGAGIWMWVTAAYSGGTAAHGIGLLIACGFVVVVTASFGPNARLLIPPVVLLATLVIVSGSRTGVLSTEDRKSVV